ncbi:PepSY domain-containing protein [Cytobacillus kochii]|uniref:PepSY domain-containing protein n=1 Tax=Cytobacillus kochii TaxID=859143 RepID=UPI0025A27272|nr:PepSY domain-containing protein [Cytobacillus kochii]MDM5205766.1 PepSY domain-containing protein [Cytobacillus kochii]
MKKVGVGLLAGAITLGGVFAATTFANDDAPKATVSNGEEVKQKQTSNTNEGTLSIEEAIKTAQEEGKGKVTDVELEWERGNLVYNVELQGNGTETDVELNANTGEVLKVKSEKEDEQDEEITLDQKLFSASDAIQLAEKEADGEFSELQLDHDNGTLIYDIELEGKQEAEIKIDALTGKVLKVELDD